MVSESNSIEIAITFNTEKIMQYGPAIVASLVMFITTILIGGNVVVIVSVLMASIIFFALTRWLSKVAPTDKPDLYRIEPDKNLLWYQEHSSGEWQDVHLSTVYKVKYINHKYRKVLNIKYQKQNKKWVALFTAPFFEKCNDDWQRLFEEIRKRIPPDAEVIIK